MLYMYLAKLLQLKNVFVVAMIVSLELPTVFSSLCAGPQFHTW